MDDATTLIRLESIRKSYGEAVQTEVLHGVDLEVRAGEFCALIGPSGSGKSTLLNILGLLDRPTSGTMFLDGRATHTLDDDARSELRGRALGFVFQFHHLLPEFTAVENVAMPLIATRGYVEEPMLERASALLGAIGLEERMLNRATDLSGGQQQRVAIARALVHEPLVVLADEPTGNLDTQTGDEVFDLLRMFNRERGTAFLIVTHDSRIADRCDRVIELIDGLIVRDGSRSRSAT